MSTLERNGEILPPAMSAQDAEMARAAQRCIMAALDHSRAASIMLTDDEGNQPVIQVPPQALKIIAQVLGAMSERRPIVVMPSKQEVSTVEAANFLNVSRPFVIKEIEQGRLPYRMVGTHRRIAFDDLAQYAEKMRERQKSALQRMADDANELGLDY
jgi:excisionase family DNA binding protein